MSTKLLIKNLQNQNVFDHEVTAFKLIETHISWVILTGKYVYKIKKPLDFGFLDFSTLEKRQNFCNKELELNQKLAPEIYLEVLPITGSEETPAINGDGKIIEYAIKMREFSQENLFDSLLKEDKLHSIQMVDLAHELANFHQRTEADGSEYFGSPEQMLVPIKENFDQIRSMIKEPQDLLQLQVIQDWSYTEHEKLIDTLRQRKQQGFVRACHGDVHLGNITMYNQKPVIFDCIEFNESFRWTDTMADLGFLLMDLYDKGQARFASIVLNTYMTHTGDYAGLMVLPYYEVYRAVVRAKISLFEYTQQTDPSEAEKRLLNYRKFMNLAEFFARPKKPYLSLTHGFSGSGKSSLAKFLVENAGMVQLRSDVERKRMQGIEVNASSHSGLYADLYSPEQTAKTYEYLLSLSKISLAAGYTTVVDATFQEKSQRALFIDYAKANNIPFCILFCQAPTEKLLDWITERSNNTSISEANKEVLLAQQDKFEMLTGDEVRHCISVNMENPLDAKIILKSIDQILQSKNI